MRCAVLYGKGDLRLEEREIPRLGPHDVLIKVSVCGICQTDGLSLHGAYVAARLPIVQGHEYCGVVADVGKAVSTVRQGDRVAVLTTATCGHCSFCRRGLAHLCLNPQVLWGGFAEYAALPEKLVYRLPDGTSELAGAMAEPVACCLHALEQAKPQAGDVVVVVGGGHIGLLLVQLARLEGASLVILSEPKAHRQSLGRQVGAHVVVDPAREDLHKVVSDLTGGIGADLALEAVGVPETVEQCLSLVRKGGTVVVLSVCASEAEARFRPFDLFHRQVTLRGVRAAGQVMERAIRLLPALSLEVLYSHQFELEDIHQAIAHHRTLEGIKGFIRFCPRCSPAVDPGKDTRVKVSTGEVPAEGLS